MIMMGLGWLLVMVGVGMVIVGVLMILEELGIVD
jgi:hypothetical protein